MYVITLVLLLLFANTLLADVGDTDLNDLSEQQNSVRINKCCEVNEIMVDVTCRPLELYNQTAWTPKFKTEDGKEAKLKQFRYVHGMPDCKTTQQRAVFYTGKSEDELNLLFDGRLEHVIHHKHSTDNVKDEFEANNMFSLHDIVIIPVEKKSSFIHMQNEYCMDKMLMKDTNTIGEYALVCVPEVKIFLFKF